MTEEEPPRTGGTRSSPAAASTLFYLIFQPKTPRVGCAHHPGTVLVGTAHPTGDMQNMEKQRTR